MKLPKNLGTILLAVWLIAASALPLLHLAIPHQGELLALVAIAAGVLLLLGK